jgi:hypothetical protein
MGKLIQFKPKAKPAPRELTDLDREVRDEVRAKYRAAKSDYNARHEAMSKLIGETNPLRVAHATEQHVKEDMRARPAGGIRADIASAREELSKAKRVGSGFRIEGAQIKIAKLQDSLRKQKAQGRGTPERMAKAAELRASRKGRVGDYPGHPFRGNQHTGGK